MESPPYSELEAAAIMESPPSSKLTSCTQEPRLPAPRTVDLYLILLHRDFTKFEQGFMYHVPVRAGFGTYCVNRTRKGGSVSWTYSALKQLQTIRAMLFTIPHLNQHISQNYKSIVRITCIGIDWTILSWFPTQPMFQPPREPGHPSPSGLVRLA